MRVAKLIGGKRAIAAAVIAAALLVATGIGNYAAWATGLGVKNFEWFTADPAADTFTLSKPGEVYAFADVVNGTCPDSIKRYALQVAPDQDGAYDFAGKTVRIATGREPDISDANDPYLKDPSGLAGELPLNAWGTHYEFQPIGTEQHPFNGTFNGNHATLLNLLIDQDSALNADPRDVGLFGVIGPEGSVSDLTLTGTISLDTAQPVCNLGAIVGRNEGSVSNAVSKVNITVRSTCDVSGLASSEDDAEAAPIENVGGVAGRVNGSIGSCSYEGALRLESAESTSDDTSGMKTARSTADAIGGVVGLLGSKTELTPGMSISDCFNHGSLYMHFTGSGGLDGWNTMVGASPSNIGGVVGFSSGSVYDCGNTGEVRAATRASLSNTSFATDRYGYDTLYDCGGMNVGGVVGNLRRVMRAESRTDPLTVARCYNTGLVIGVATVGGIVGTAGAYSLITECANGNALAANNNREADNDTLPTGQGAVVTTRWNKPFGAGICGASYGTISYCYNRGEINNTQSGYYMAGIVGSLGYSTPSNVADVRDDPTYLSECYGCYNVGVIGPGHVVTDRYGAIIGESNRYAYLHDCVVRSGCVSVNTQSAGSDIFNQSYAIGGSNWYQWDNITILSAEEIKSSTATSALNARCEQDGGYDVQGLRYWFSGYGAADPDANGNRNYNDGYPVLTTYAEPKNGIQLDAARLSELSVTDAVFSKDRDPVPTVELSYTNDAGVTVVLQQNADFLIEPQQGARERTDGSIDARPYRYSVRGIGTYAGYVQDFGRYGITVGTLSDMTVLVNGGEGETQKFDWEVQFPNSLQVLDASGAPLATDNYTWVIYDSGTNNITSAKAPKFVVFDSAGFVVFDDEPDERVPALDAVSTINRIVDAQDKRSFVVYDRTGQKISDSAGLVYDQYGSCVSASFVNRVRYLESGTQQTTGAWVGFSCFGYKTATTNDTWAHTGAAGYTVEVRGENDYEGALLEGRYIIETATLDADCTVTAELDGDIYTLGYDDAGQKGAYRIDERGQKVWNDASVPFRAQSYIPPMSATWLGRELLPQGEAFISEYHNTLWSSVAGYDYVYGYGGDEVISTVDYRTPIYLRNRNATTTDGSAYGARASVGTSQMFWVGRDAERFDTNVKVFTGFGDFDFEIEPISSVDVQVSASATSALPVRADATGDEEEDAPCISAPVMLTLGDSTLLEGYDYTLSYETAEGEALPQAPSEKGDYVVEVHMAPLNFTDDLADVGSEYRIPFTVEDAKPFKVVTEDRPAQVGLTVWGDSWPSIPDTDWDAADLYPQISFAKLDENGDVVLDANGDVVLDEDMAFGRDYVFYVYDDIYDEDLFVPSLAINAITRYSENTPLPFVEGVWLTTPGNTSWGQLYTEYDRPYCIRVVGLGAYEGQIQDVAWLVKPIDIAQTDAADWEVSDIKVWINSSSNRSIKASAGRIAYKGVTISQGSTSSSCVRFNADPYYPLNVGDEVTFSLAAIPGGGGFYGTRRMDDVISETIVVPPFDISTSSNFKLSVENVKYVYDGSSHLPKASVNGLLDEDYVIDYRNTVDAGMGTVIATANRTASGQGNYIGVRTTDYPIAPRPLGCEGIELTMLAGESYPYTGEEVEPAVQLIDNGLSATGDCWSDPDDAYHKLRDDGSYVLKPGIDYEVSYASNLDAGQGTLIVTGKGNYTGTISRAFTIEYDPSNLSYYVSFVYALDNTRTIASTQRLTYDASAVPEGEPIVVEVHASDFAKGADPVVDPEKWQLQGEGVKTLVLDPSAKNVVYFEYLGRRSDGTWEEMPKVEGMSVDKQVRAGYGTYAVAKVYPTNLNQGVVWTTSDTDIAAVDQSGAITAGITPGIVRITATSLYDPSFSESLYLANPGAGMGETLHDATSGISLSGMPAGCRLSIVAVPEQDYYSWLGVYDRMLSCFDIAIYADYEGEQVEVQPIGEAQLTIPLGLSIDELEGNLLFAYHYLDDGLSYERLRSIVQNDDGTIAVAMNHFSRIELFGTVVEAGQDPGRPTDPADPEGPSLIVTPDEPPRTDGGSQPAQPQSPSPIPDPSDDQRIDDVQIGQGGMDPTAASDGLGATGVSVRYGTTMQAPPATDGASSSAAGASQGSSEAAPTTASGTTLSSTGNALSIDAGRALVKQEESASTPSRIDPWRVGAVVLVCAALAAGGAALILRTKRVRTGLTWRKLK